MKHNAVRICRMEKTHFGMHSIVRRMYASRILFCHEG